MNEILATFIEEKLFYMSCQFIGFQGQPKKRVGGGGSYVFPELKRNHRPDESYSYNVTQYCTVVLSILY